MGLDGEAEALQRRDRASVRHKVAPQTDHFPRVHSDYHAVRLPTLGIATAEACDAH